MRDYPPIEQLIDENGNSVAYYLEKYKSWEEEHEPKARYEYSLDNFLLLKGLNPNTVWTKYSTFDAEEVLEKGLHDYDAPDIENVHNRFTWEWIVCQVPWGHDTESPLNISPVVPCWKCKDEDTASEDCEYCRGFDEVVFYFEENKYAPKLEGREDEDVVDIDA